MKFSLIMCTANRVNEVRRFFEFISKQTYNNFEIVLVDQNKDDRLQGITEEYGKLINLIYIKSDQVGLSKNRNIGLKYKTGDIIAFPDDDCVYPRHTLERVHEAFVNNKNVDSITIQFTKLIGEGHEQLEINDFNTITNVKRVNKYNCIRRTCSITIFVSKKVHENIGGFDEKLGLGETLIPAGEDYEYALGILKNGFNMFYIPQIAVLHPVLKLNLLDKNEYDRNKKRIESTSKVIMYIANYHKLGLDFKIVRISDRILGLLFRAIMLDLKRCNLIFSDLRSMFKYWYIRI
ncbi:glycosyltransferase family 2 protein [Paenibacillus sp. GP183]|uniref:glycosyltransferase family 2 protein n=1 Tax=Paenibacillus sp. GP183 TaxID=1882751 RepID=UPI0008981D46|nr:glycosyltransferase family 2 protein [Paenibacillus sp. GP183]SEC11302.1 Glycosyltransferase, GT2 family [Paenibacillus sp. GP183]